MKEYADCTHRVQESTLQVGQTMSRRASMISQVELPLSAKMTTPTVSFLEEAGNEFNACKKMPPKSPRFDLMKV